MIGGVVLLFWLTASERLAVELNLGKHIYVLAGYARVLVIAKPE